MNVDIIEESRHQVGQRVRCNGVCTEYDKGLAPRLVAGAKAVFSGGYESN